MSLSTFGKTFCLEIKGSSASPKALATPQNYTPPLLLLPLLYLVSVVRPLTSLYSSNAFSTLSHESIYC